MNSNVDCFEGVPQEFLVCITVHKAANVTVSNSDLYVRVTIDKVSKRTRSFSNSANPFYNEYFVYEFKCTLTKLLHQSVLFEVRKQTVFLRNATIAEVQVDLHSVWSQPNHSYYKKWGRLSAPINALSVATEEDILHGHLLIDLAIVSQHSSITQDPSEYSANKYSDCEVDNIESNLLENGEGKVNVNVRYFISFYRSYFTKKCNYMIQISFAGFHAKSHVVRHTMEPQWNYQISLAWQFPDLSSRFLILIMAQDHLQWKCVGEYEIPMDEIAFKDTPTLGPTYLHFYSPNKPNDYVGRLLMQFQSEKLKEKNPVEAPISSPIVGINESHYWSDNIYQVEFLPIQGDHIYCSNSEYRIFISMAEFQSNIIEGHLSTPTGKTYTALSTKFFRQQPPYRSCLFNIRLPDSRVKHQSDLFINDVIEHMTSELEAFKVYKLKYSSQHVNIAKCLQSLIDDTLKMIKHGMSSHRFDYNDGPQRTKWDLNRQLYLVDYFSNFPRELRALQKKLKASPLDHLDSTIVDVMNEIYRIVGELQNMLIRTRVQDKWPDLMLIFNAGGQQMICKVNPFQYVEPNSQSTYNSLCWRTRNFIFKAMRCRHSCVNCGCATAVILGCLSIDLERDRSTLMSRITQEWMSPEPLLWKPNVQQTIFLCRIYIHQAKVRPMGEGKRLCDGHLRILCGDYVWETFTVLGSLTPIWNCVVTIPQYQLPGSIDWYNKNPPVLGVELFGTTKTNANLIGRGHYIPNVIARKHLDHKIEDSFLIHDSAALHKMRQSKFASPPPLKWVPVAKNGTITAEILMSAEVIEGTDLENASGRIESVMENNIPLSIRPNMINFVMEVIFVGLRNYQKIIFCMAGKRRIRIMMADLVLNSGLSMSRVSNSINFLLTYASGVVSLPDQQDYWPAIIAVDVALNGIKSESALGAAIITNPTSFLQKDKKKKCICMDNEDKATSSTYIVEPEPDEAVPDEPKQPDCCDQVMAFLGLRTSAYANQTELHNETYDDPDLTGEMLFTWWTKYYNSINVDSNHKKTEKNKFHLVVFNSELESMPEFSHLQDWAVSVPMVHGTKTHKDKPPKEEVYATLKVMVKLTPCVCGTTDSSGVGGGGGGDSVRPLAAALNPRFQSKVQALSDSIQILVRVYVVQATHMGHPKRKEAMGVYVKLTLGNKSVSDKANHLPHQSNPIFGRTFDLQAKLPGDNLLTISLYDHVLLLEDNAIGSTRIDLEDRWHSRHRATVGIAAEYSAGGYNKWRDNRLPSEILSDLCKQQNIEQPYFYGSVVQVDGKLFADQTTISTSEPLQERLSLTVLQNLEKLPSFGYRLVPEHVETRSLYLNKYPGIVQGKIHLWLELFESNMYVPLPIDITPIPPISYEVRVVIVGLRGIAPGDINVFGTLMSDLVVVGWCQNAHKTQRTDIHYRSLNGKAQFNWRMIFPLEYSPHEDMMVASIKDSVNVYAVKRPPIIYLSVFDDDVVTKDEHLCTIDLNLSNLQMPHSIIRKKKSRINLFQRKKIIGWFDLEKYPKTSRNLKYGAINLEIEVLTQVEAANNPAGLGRKPPLALKMPNREKTSFNPYTHPMKSFRYILWPAVRRYVIALLLIGALILGLVIFFSTFPGKLMGIPVR